MKPNKKRRRKEPRDRREQRAPRTPLYGDVIGRPGTHGIPSIGVYCGKFAYETRRLAKMFAKRLDGNRAYKCERCGHFHVGRSNAGFREELREGRAS
jgi:hypothetical protein